MRIHRIDGESNEEYVVDNTLEYLENNEQAKQLPDKVIESCDKILDEFIEEEE